MELRERLTQASIRGEHDGDVKAAVVAEWHNMIDDLAILRQVLEATTFLMLASTMVQLLEANETSAEQEFHKLLVAHYANRQLYQLLGAQHSELEIDLPYDSMTISGDSSVATTYQMINEAISNARHINLQLCP